MDGRIPFGDVLGDFFFVSLFRDGAGRVLFVIGDISRVAFVVRGVSASSSVGVSVPCWWLVEDSPGASSGVRGFCASYVGGCPNRVSLAAWIFFAKQNFSILRLFRLYSPTVLHASKFMSGLLVLVVFGVFRRIWLCRCCVLQGFSDYVCRW